MPPEIASDSTIARRSFLGWNAINIKENYPRCFHRDRVARSLGRDNPLGFAGSGGPNLSAAPAHKHFGLIQVFPRYGYCGLEKTLLDYYFFSVRRGKLSDGPSDPIVRRDKNDGHA